VKKESITDELHHLTPCVELGHKRIIDNDTDLYLVFNDITIPQQY